MDKENKSAVQLERSQFELGVMEAYYSGERIVLKDNNGLLAAIVPIEDLEFLEEVDHLSVKQAKEKEWSKLFLSRVKEVFVENQIS